MVLLSKIYTFNVAVEELSFITKFGQNYGRFSAEISAEVSVRMTEISVSVVPVASQAILFRWG